MKKVIHRLLAGPDDRIIMMNIVRMERADMDN